MVDFKNSWKGHALMYDAQKLVSKKAIHLSC